MSFEGKFEGKSGANTRILLDANSADITAGGGGRGGDVLVKNDQGQVTIRLDGGGEEGLTGIPESRPGRSITRPRRGGLDLSQRRGRPPRRCRKIFRRNPSSAQGRNARCGQYR